MIEVEYSTPKGDAVAKGTIDAWLQPVTGPMGQRRPVTVKATAIPILKEPGKIIVMSTRAGKADITTFAPWVPFSDQASLDAGKRIRMAEDYEPSFLMFPDNKGPERSLRFSRMESSRFMGSGYKIKGIYVSRTDQDIQFDVRKWLPWAYKDHRYMIKRCNTNNRSLNYNTCITPPDFRRPV